VGIVLLTKKKFCQKIKKEIISKLKCCFSLWR
jgi:hypothetical protein